MSAVAARGTDYVELGPNFHKMQQRATMLKRRRRELGSLGYEITVRDLEAEAAA